MVGAYQKSCCFQVVRRVQNTSHAKTGAGSDKIAQAINGGNDRQIKLRLAGKFKSQPGCAGQGAAHFKVQMPWVAILLPGSFSVCFL
jgi:hypothetical protein